MAGTSLGAKPPTSITPRTRTQVYHGLFGLGALGCSASTSLRDGDAGFVWLRMGIDNLVIRIHATPSQIREAIQVLTVAADAADAQRREKAGRAAHSGHAPAQAVLRRQA